MKELIKITENAVNARELHEYLGIKHLFRNWISNAIRDYHFEENKDFSYFFNESNGGRPRKEYAISINMAKELSMVCKTDKGREARKYFIKCEDIAKKSYADYMTFRTIGKEARKCLTDKVKEAGENERMHGYGYEKYTMLVYEIVGLKEKYKSCESENFRETLSKEELDNVKRVESFASLLLESGKQYSEIKADIGDIFIKRINN